MRLTDMEEDLEKQEAARLMAAMASGDEDALVAVINLYQQPVYNFLARMGCDPQQAEDYAQETFVRLYQHAASYTPQAKLITYLLTIARNCLIDHARRRKMRESALSGQEAAPRDVSPALQAERSEFRRNVAAALQALPDNQREAVALAVVEDVPYETVSEILGVPLGTVKSRVYYGLKALRETLQRQGYQSGAF